MNIRVYDEVNGNGELTVKELTQLAPEHFTLEERVPGVSGQAIDLKLWFRSWTKRQQGEEAGAEKEPVLLRVEAADEFQASIPWSQLDQACLLYAQADGSPLKKGYPIRLYVPDGSSECLNVKSVVRIQFLYEGLASEEATYGFKNTVTPDQLKLKK
jgi:DMSO/TMAO reductase YedYZ molybdopterin-dependent catalytic subunit